MPIKKTEENSETKHCPYCDNEIKAKAIKCQYCGEFLDKNSNENKVEKKVEVKTKKVKSDSIEKIKSSAISAGKFLRWGCIGMFIRLGIAFLSGIFDWEFSYTEAFNAIDRLSAIALLILFMVRSNKSYKYILNIGAEKLHHKSTGWPTRGWICPFANLIVPYYSVLDIYKTNIKDKGTDIIGWWWGCYLGSSIILNVFSNYEGEASGYIAWIGIGLTIAKLILTMNIVKNIESELEE